MFFDRFQPISFDSDYLERYGLLYISKKNRNDFRIIDGKVIFKDKYALKLDKDIIPHLEKMLDEEQMLRRKIVEKYCDVEIQDWYEQKRTMCYEVYMSAAESVRRFEYTRLYCFALIILFGGGLLPTFALWATTNNPLVVLAPILFAMVAFFVLLPSLYLIIFHVRPIRLWLDRKENPRFEKLVKNKIRNKIMYGKRDSGTEGM